jgi:hypothetical protein
MRSNGQQRIICFDLAKRNLKQHYCFLLFCLVKRLHGLYIDINASKHCTGNFSTSASLTLKKYKRLFVHILMEIRLGCRRDTSRQGKDIARTK